MKYLIILALLLVPLSAYAAHQNLEKPCNISITGQYFQITINGENRGNPDNSFYPGDGFHYLFLFKASDTCNSFSVKPVESEGGIKLLSHNSVRGQNSHIIQNNGHPHDDFNMEPKYLTTFHFSKITSITTDCIVHRGGTRSCNTSYSVSDNPVFSYREDKKLSQSDGKKISYYSKNSNKFLKTETQSWGFARIGIHHGHEDSNHVYEDDESIKSFENFVKDTCSNLSKNQGCVYGHAEIDVEIISELCLYAELKKLGIDKADMPPQDVCVNQLDKLHLTIKGTKIVCSTDDSGNKICKLITITRDKNLTPNVLSANFDLVLEKPPLKDRDYYDAKNLADTYYLHDPVTITHNPDLPYKENRSQTIQFVTTKTNPILLESDFDCTDNDCHYTIPLNSL